MGAPTINANDTTIMLGTVIAASDLFTITDPDNDPILNVGVYDTFGGAGSGYWTFNGVVQGAKSWITVSAANLANLVYHAGTQISKETIRIRASDASGYGPIKDIWMYTVVENLTRPVTNAPNFSVVQNEWVTMSDIISANDPDGHPITHFRFNDRNIGNGSGYFSFKGQKMPARQQFVVLANELDQVRFFAAFGAPNNDRLDVWSYDGATWSFRKTINGTTTVNANRPIVVPEEPIVSINERVSMRGLFHWNDADGNTAKAFRFFDTSAHDWTGHLLINGVEQASKSWIQVSNSQLDLVEFQAASRFFTEEVRVQVFDGKHWSPIETIRIRTDERPVFDVPDVQIFDELEEIPITSIISKADQGPIHTQFQVYDTNPDLKSGKFRLGLTDFAANQVHTFTPLQFNNLVFKGSVIDIRGLDEVYIRANNGTFWGDWQRLNARSEPNMMAMQVTDWYPYLPARNPLVITYSFMIAWPAYGTAGEAPEDQFIAPWQAFKDGFRQMFEDVEQYVNVDFQEVPDTFIDPLTGTPGGTIRIGTYCVEPPSAVAYASFPGPTEVAGDIWFNRYFIGGPSGPGPRGSNIAGPMGDPPACETSAPDPNTGLSYLDPRAYTYGTFPYFVMLHELGHSLGMKHSFEIPFISPGAESSQYTVMSYSDDFNGVYEESYMLYDLANLQNTYGAANLNPGDTVYNVAYFDNHPGSGGFTQQRILWDTGGYDIIDTSHSTVSNTLTLRQGDFNSIDGFPNNFAIAWGTYIEAAIGGLGNDSLTGNERDNSLTGGLGDDVLEGFGGADFLSGGEGNDTFIWKMSDGHDVIDEDRKAGRDRIEIGLMLGLNDFATDMSFSKVNNGLDLLIDLTIDEGLSRGSIHINKQKWGGSRVETLEFLGQDIDLQYLFNNISHPGQQFTISNQIGTYGFLVTPI